MGGPRLPGRSCTADFGAELMCRDSESILFASIFKLTEASRRIQGRLGKRDCSKKLSTVQSLQTLSYVSIR